MGALARVSIQGYRAVRDLEFAPGSVCALVGERRYTGNGKVPEP